MSASNTPFCKTCKKCGGRSERVATFPKSTENAGYEVYQCVDCKFVEWLPHDQHHLMPMSRELSILRRGRQEPRLIKRNRPDAT